MDQTLIYATVAALIVAVLFYIVSRPTKKPVTPTKKEEKKEEKPKMSEEVKSEEKHPVFLNRERQKVPLIKKIELSHDTHLYRFGLPTPDTVLGLPIGKHFKLFCPNVVGVEPGKWNGRDDPEAGKDEIQRSYTPTSSDDDKGHFDLVVKVYSAGVVERFPDGGKASQYLNSLSIGDEITISGPFGLIEYKGNGVLERARKQFNATHIGMISGGTGITPMLQIINAVLKNPNDPTKLSLLFANQTEADILVRDILEQLVAEHSDRFSIWYTLDRPPTVGWEYSTGFINEKMISDHLPAPAENTAILMCGPPPMIEYACKPNLKAAGHDEKAFFVF